MKVSMLLVVFLAGVSFVASSPYVVEVLFVVAPQVVDEYMKFGYDKHTAIKTIRGDFDLFLYEVNRFYQSMRKSVNIEIRSKKLQFTPDGVFYGSDQDDVVKTHEVMGKLMKWIEITKAYENVGGFDMAILFTGSLLSDNGNHPISGHATVGTMCKKSKSRGVVLFDGTEKTALAIAQVIGFNLGANIAPCNKGYVMSGSNAITRQFSTCSTNKILNFIKGLNKNGKNCLRHTTSVAPHFKLNSQEYRDILNVDKVCQRALKDTNAFLCQNSNMYKGLHAKGDPFCQSLYCQTKGASSCISVAPTEGMVCDQGKRCHDGQCVTAPPGFPVATMRDSECIHGDVKYLKLENKLKTCKDVVSKKKASCYNPDIRQRCCESCSRVELNISGCEYGNRLPECRKYEAARICTNGGNRKTCCELCRGWNDDGPIIGK